MKTKLILAGFAALCVLGLSAQNVSYNVNSIPLGGTNNTGFGANVLGAANPGVGHVAIGQNVLKVCSGGVTGYNVGVGTNALIATTTGYYNSVCGASGLGSNTTGYQNSALGTLALYSNTTGVNNSALGFNALYNNLTGSQNTGAGVQTLYTNTTGDCNNALGYGADVSSASLSNATAIGCLAVVNASNKIRLGNSSITVVEGPVAYTTSDVRFKSNITENDVKGLDFIRLLRPVVYNFDTRKFQEFLVKSMPADQREKYLMNDFSASTAIRQSGFIAQEVEKAAQQAGYNFNGIHKPDNDNDNYSLAYSQFVVPLVKAVQEMDKQNSDLKAMITDLQKQVSDLSNAKTTGTATGINQNNPGSAGFSMSQNEPNPFSGETVIKYILPQSYSAAAMYVYDLSGKQVTAFPITDRGSASMTITSEKLQAGIYIYSIIADGKVMDSKRMVVANK